VIGGVLIEFGWCGFGWDDGLFPELRAGVVRVCCYRGSFIEKYLRTAGTLRLALQFLRGDVPATQAGIGPAIHLTAKLAGDPKRPPALFEGDAP
jgi:hypothetical protein